MNENDLSDLSYKELQALAHTYRVPGNIKKHLLVRTLQAIQSGNELEVGRMLTEVQQTRKKRVKKQKLNIMNVSSTPTHSPNYTIVDDCYYTRHQPPYQWVGAEEEIAIREDDAMRVPNYTEFQQFLLRRLQRDQYEAYSHMKENEAGQGPSIVDLRMGAGSSVLRPISIDPNQVKSSMTIDPINYVRPSSEIELQILDDRSDENQARPELLKKLLEAPAGANLGEIASPDTASQRIWSLDQYPNNGNPMDDSDTLTADSEIDNDDVWNNNNNGNINNAVNYYYPVNELKNHTHEPDISSRIAENIGQLRNNTLAGESIQPYPFEYHVTDIQSNCEKWIAANNFVNRDAAYAEQVTENSRTYNSIYYENNSGNSTITRSINRDRKYQYNETNEIYHYEANQTIIHGQRFNWPNESHPHYQSNNAIVQPTAGNPNEIYYPQQMAKQAIPDGNREYFTSGSNDIRNIQNSSHMDVQSSITSTEFVGNIYKDAPIPFHHHYDNNNDMQYNMGYYQYSHENAQQTTGFSGTMHPNQQEQTSEILKATIDRKNLVESSTAQSISNGVLDPFWPRWPINPAQTSNGYLETILNLYNRGNSSIDSSKANETSCVYCYTEPIVTQRIESSHTWCTQNKPLIAEKRQHLFTPNVLVYNDASTGMIMANITGPSNVNQSQETSKDETLNSSMDPDYELKVSDNSSDSSINDVWIHDYENYPVSSDNALQGIDLTNDEENDDDLFSTVRYPSRNSIDDHTIETFTDINY